MRGVDNSLAERVRYGIVDSMSKTLVKPKRELATKNIRIYESTLISLQAASNVEGKTIARIIAEMTDWKMKFPLKVSH